MVNPTVSVGHTKKFKVDLSGLKLDREIAPPEHTLNFPPATEAARNSKSFDSKYNEKLSGMTAVIAHKYHNRHSPVYTQHGEGVLKKLQSRNKRLILGGLTFFSFAAVTICSAFKDHKDIDVPVVTAPAINEAKAMGHTL